MSLLNDREVAHDLASPEYHVVEVDSTRRNGTTSSTPRIRVLLAEDSHVLRETVVQILAHEPDIEVVGEAGDGVEAVALTKAAQPDVVLMDYTMPRLDGVEATRRIAAELPQVRVIGFSLHDEQYVGAKMVAAGAVAYVTKGESLERLIHTIRSASVLRPSA